MTSIHDRVLGEIVSSEASYVRNLEFYVSVFVKPLGENSTHSYDAGLVRRVRSNVEEILAFHRVMLSELEEAEEEGESLHLIILGNLRQMAALYTIYIESYSVTTRAFEGLCLQSSFRVSWLCFIFRLFSNWAWWVVTLILFSLSLSRYIYTPTCTVYVNQCASRLTLCLPKQNYHRLRTSIEIRGPVQ